VANHYSLGGGVGRGRCACSGVDCGTGRAIGHFPGGQATFGVLDDVVTLTAVGSLFAQLVLALTVTDLNGPAGGATKEPLLDPDIDPAAGLEHRSFNVGTLQPGQQRAWGHHRALGQFTHAAMEGFVVHQHRKERGRGLPSDGAVAERMAMRTKASWRRWA